MKILHVVGARPNFMKLAPCHRALAADGAEQIVVHTGQHYDEAMSDSFFRDLEIPPPDINLEVGSASHAVQTARIMERFEPVALEHRPDWVLVYGDVNSTAAAALVCAKIPLLRLAHVEAGLRSGDRSMPEEINRLVTDRLADLLLTPSRDADENLKREGVDPEKIMFVGNVMVDTLLNGLPRAREQRAREQLGVREGEYALVTIHRPSNVDSPSRLAQVAAALGRVARAMPVIFPMHPRTRDRLSERDRACLGDVRLMEPLPYHSMLDLTAGARVVITDSGGLQEETTALGVPCLTVRENTERPVTVTEGTNRLAPDPDDFVRLALDSRRNGSPQRPEGWDGRAALRISAALRAGAD